VKGTSTPTKGANKGVIVKPLATPDVLVYYGCLISLLCYGCCQCLAYNDRMFFAFPSLLVGFAVIVIYITITWRFPYDHGDRR